MVLLLLVLMLSQSTVKASSCSTTAIDSWVQIKQTKLCTKVFKTFSFICRVVCYEACLAFDDCYSVNYFPGSKTCELNNGNHLEFPEILTPSDSSEYAYTLSKGFPIKLTNTPVCFSAEGDSPGIINVTIPGQISSFRLVHVSGFVNNSISHFGNWGSTFFGFSIIITDRTNKIISPPIYMLDDLYSYLLPNCDPRDDPAELILPEIDPPFQVTAVEEIKVWHGEDLKNVDEFDNHGTSCVFVYANYKKFIF